MKKILTILVSTVFIASLISGCGSRAVLRNKKNNKSSTAGTTDQVSKDTSKLTDNDLMSIANDKDETAITEDGIDLDKELSDLDSIINQKDTLSDIPKSVDLR
jgi:hypothetical protein